MASLIKLNSKVTLPKSLLDYDFNETLVHQVVTSIMTNDRAGTKAQKNRSAVSGGGRKPKAQKGGGARMGTIRSPLCRGGGVTFAAQPRKFNQKINKKMYHQAMRTILAQLAREERLVIVDDISLDKPSTKNMAASFAAAKIDNRALLVTDALDENVYLSVRNLENVNMATIDIINPVDLLAHDVVVMTATAAKNCGERFA